jgi:hypothetical protein
LGKQWELPAVRLELDFVLKKDADTRLHAARTSQDSAMNYASASLRMDMERAARRLPQYFALTKPRVVSLIVFMAVIGMFLAARHGGVSGREHDAGDGATHEHADAPLSDHGAGRQ